MEQPLSVQTVENTFPIVAIGASAGGLEALERFFNHIPTNSGMTFVIVTHLDPTHKTLLPQLLRHYTEMKVCQLKSEHKPQLNFVYIMPPNSDLVFSRGKFKVVPRDHTHHLRFPIDIFFTSLAKQRMHPVIGVILSGTGTDGTLGLKAIKAAGGRVIVQSLHSAQYEGMPRSALNTGIADASLPPEEIPAQIMKYIKEGVTKIDKQLGTLQQIFSLLHVQSGHDFSLYKYKTIDRRIKRRMLLHHMDKLTDYLQFLEQNPLEINNLFKELLIGVTRFFRDTEAFVALKRRLMQKISENDPPIDNLRVWVPGCSNGEEAYSIAILVQECINTVKRPLNVQIFGTDIDEAAINRARAGIYSADIAAVVSPTRLRRFFTKNNGTYGVNKNIRKTVIFACQDIIKDPPFTNLDLLCCRNLLIYLDTTLQNKLLPLFHYCLKPNGMLFLGLSESIGGFNDMFTVVDKKWKIFQRRETSLSRQAHITFPIMTTLKPGTADEAATKESSMTTKPKPSGIEHLAENFLLQNYGPPCVIVNSIGDILYVHGRTGKYLEPAPGKVRFNVQDMIHPDLKVELVSALHQAVAQRKEVVMRNLSIKDNKNVQTINLKVKPLLEQDAIPGLIAIVFEAIAPEQHEKKLKPNQIWAKKITELQKTLKDTKASLQLAIDQHKLGAEELQSTNEELQSNNEEIETSKEELQSLNEELMTVNSELEARIDQLSSTNNDMKNLLDSTDIATLFLDNDLCIKRFTPRISQLINLINLDIGRSLSHFVCDLDYANLVEDAGEVLKTLIPKNIDVKNKAGYWYNVRIIPYRTVTNVIEGVVITFVDINEQKQMDEELKRLNKLLQDALDYSENIIATVSEPFLVLDSDLKIVSANRSFYKIFQTSKDTIQGQYIYDLENRQWDIVKLRELLEKIILKNSSFDDFPVEYKFPETGVRNFLLNARKIFRPGLGKTLILLAMREIIRT